MDASLDEMELCNDMEPTPVDDAMTGREHSMDASLGGMELCSDTEPTPVVDAMTGREHSVDASLDEMELCNDTEFTPVVDAKTGREHSMDSSEVIYASMKTVSLSSDIDTQTTDDKNEQLEFSQLITNALEITETASTPVHLENVSKDDIDTQVLQHDVEITDQASDDETEQNEFSQLITESLEVTKTASTSDNVPIDDTGVDETGAFSMDDHVELAQPPNSDINLLITKEHADMSDQSLQYTDARDDVGQEKYYNVVIAAEEVYGSSDENSEPADTADDVGKTSVVLLYSSGSVEVQNDDVHVLSETIHRDTDATGLNEMTDSAVSTYAPEIADTRKTKSLRVMENGEHENTTGCASTVQTAHSATADLEFYTDVRFIKTENNITEQHTDSSFLNNKESVSTVCYVYQDCPFSDDQSEKQLELFTADDACLQPQRLELDDLTLTVTCYIPEESEELLLDDAVEDVSEEDTYFEAPSLPSSGKLTANDPVMSSGLAHYIDQNAVSADIILPRRRSSDFMLSYLMPIDETAEFTDTANADDDDLASNKSHLLQPDVNVNDLETQPNSNGEQKMAYNINASPTVEHAHCLCHELTEKNHQWCVAAVSGVEEHGLDSSLPNVYDIGVTAVLDDGHKMKSSDNEQQQLFEESHSSVEDPVDRNDGNVSDRHSSTEWFSANQQVAGTNRYISEVYIDVVARNSKAATNVAQVSHLLDDNNAHATTLEHTTLTLKSLNSVQVCSEDNNEMFVSLAADATQHSLSANSLKKSAESIVSDFGNELQIHSAKQNRVQTDDAKIKYLDNQNTETVDLDMEIYSNAVATFSENSVTTQIRDLKYNNEPSKQNVETALQLCEIPVLQSSSDIQTALETILQSFAKDEYETAEDKQQTIAEERPLSQIATNDTGACHSCASVLRDSSLLVAKAPDKFEEPAEDSATDFESTLEHLHSA